MKVVKLLLLGLVLTGTTRNAGSQQAKPSEKRQFGFLQCRADAQRWTYDPFDKKLDFRFSTGAAVMVNGQFRVLPHLTYGATATQLLERIHESAVCEEEDADFEKQFKTYSTFIDSYQEERTFRYMQFVQRHNLDAQFLKEDAEEFK